MRKMANPEDYTFESELVRHLKLQINELLGEGANVDVWSSVCVTGLRM